MSAAQTVATIGVFDGVHVGHQALVARAADRARQRGLPLTAVTFDPDPMSVLIGRDAVPSLLPLDRRIELLTAAGADRVEVLQFNEDLLLTSPEDFIARILVERLGVTDIVIGPDFQFGYKAAGNVGTLQEAGARLGFGVEVVGMVGDGTQRWSATRIRTLVAEGEVARAAEGLTRPYGMDGVVVHGDHRGRELGYPTANLSWAGYPAVPGDGVYAGYLVVGGQSLPAAISVGTNPQFGGQQRRVEAYVLDATDLDLYGHRVRIDFVSRLRGQEVFADLQGLVGQMAVDVDRARALLTATESAEGSRRGNADGLPGPW